MQTPQTGIFALGDAAHGLFEFSLRTDADVEAAVTALVSVCEPRATVGGANRVLGFLPSLWRKLAPNDAPLDAHDFEEPIEGSGGYIMPATQGDIWAWFSAANYDTVFDMGRGAVESIAQYAALEREYRGWVYHHNRDLTGFQDGTENPPLDEAPDIALVGDGNPGAGGSVALFQVWKQTKRAFHDLPIATQEAVIGRTKADSIELEEAQMPADSHVSRTTLDVDGKELDIFRRNVPYGPERHGERVEGAAIVVPGGFADRREVREAAGITESPGEFVLRHAGGAMSSPPLTVDPVQSSSIWATSRTISWTRIGVSVG